MNAILLLALALVLAACSSSSPVGVSRVDPSVVHERLTRSALSNKQLSSPTYNVLLEADLDALYADDPEKALERLHDLAVSGSGGPRQLFAAAEAEVFEHAAHSCSRHIGPEDALETLVRQCDAGFLPFRGIDVEEPLSRTAAAKLDH